MGSGPAQPPNSKNGRWSRHLSFPPLLFLLMVRTLSTAQVSLPHHLTARSPSQPHASRPHPLLPTFINSYLTPRFHYALSHHHHLHHHPPPLSFSLIIFLRLIADKFGSIVSPPSLWPARIHLLLTRNRQIQSPSNNPHPPPPPAAYLRHAGRTTRR